MREKCRTLTSQGRRQTTGPQKRYTHTPARTHTNTAPSFAEYRGLLYIVVVVGVVIPVPVSFLPEEGLVEPPAHVLGDVAASAAAVGRGGSVEEALSERVLVDVLELEL